jgi:hypothetical protein
MSISGQTEALLQLWEGFAVLATRHPSPTGAELTATRDRLAAAILAASEADILEGLVLDGRLDWHLVARSGACLMPPADPGIRQLLTGLRQTGGPDTLRAFLVAGLCLPPGDMPLPKILPGTSAPVAACLLNHATVTVKPQKADTISAALRLIRVSDLLIDLLDAPSADLLPPLLQAAQRLDYSLFQECPEVIAFDLLRVRRLLLDRVASHVPALGPILTIPSWHDRTAHPRHRVGVLLTAEQLAAPDGQTGSLIHRLHAAGFEIILYLASPHHGMEGPASPLPARALCLLPPGAAEAAATIRADELDIFLCAHPAPTGIGTLDFLLRARLAPCQWLLAGGGPGSTGLPSFDLVLQPEGQPAGTVATETRQFFTPSEPESAFQTVTAGNRDIAQLLAVAAGRWRMLDIGACLSDVGERLLRDDLDGALALLSDKAYALAYHTARRHEILAHRDMDALCRAIGQRVAAGLAPPRMPLPGRRPRCIHLASNLHPVGGHTLHLLDMVAARPQMDHLVLCTDFHHQDRDGVETLIAGAGATIIWGQAGRGLACLEWLLTAIASERPAQIFLWGHPEDAALYAAALPDLADQVAFIHHSDHCFSLGPYLEGVVHVDLHAHGHACCRHQLGIADGVLLSLVCADRGRRDPSRAFMEKGELTTASAGAAYKFKKLESGSLCYGTLIADRLRLIPGRHYHIGLLDTGQAGFIRSCLARDGIDPDRFIIMGNVSSVWDSMQDLGVDLFIGSFPIGSGRTAIEVIGSGTPLIHHANPHARLLWINDIAGPDNPVFHTREQFLDLLVGLTPASLAQRGEQARAYYERCCRPANLRASLDNLASAKWVAQTAPLPLAWIDGLLDEAYYARTYPDLADAVPSLAEHYRHHGHREGRQPHPLFDVVHYRQEYGDQLLPGLSEIADFLQAGWRLGRNPHPLFDVTHYLRQQPDAAPDPLGDYLRRGWREGHDPHPLFNNRHYRAHNADILGPDMEPLTHFLETGWRLGCNPHPLFDVAYYLRENPDVADVGINPLEHFIRQGWRELRHPHPDIDLKYLREACLSGDDEQINPMLQFLADAPSDLLR